MPNAAEKIDHRTLPRKKRAPSARDQAILVAYRTQGRTQASLAKEYGISQRRVSEIIRRVERWRADLIPSEANQLDDDERQRLDRWLERERDQAIYDRAIRAFDSAPRKLKTVKKGERDGKPFQETTLRQVATSGQLLNTALRASRDLGRVSDKPPTKKPERSEQERECDRFWTMKNKLYDLRREAEQAGRVIRGEDTNDYISVVDCVVEALRGERNEVSTETGPGTPLHEVSALLAPPGHTPDLTALSREQTCSPSTAENASVPDSDKECSNCSNSASAESAELQSSLDVPIPNPQSKIPNSPSKPASREVRDYLIRLRRFHDKNLDPSCHPDRIWNRPVTSDEIRQFEQRAAANTRVQ